VSRLIPIPKGRQEGLETTGNKYGEGERGIPKAIVEKKKKTRTGDTRRVTVEKKNIIGSHFIGRKGGKVEGFLWRTALTIVGKEKCQMAHLERNTKGKIFAGEN